jgi:metallo-beta-lactamase class B
MFAKSAIAALACTFLASCVAPQGDAPAPSTAALIAARTLAADPAEWVAACADWDDWDKPAPAFRVHGDTYHVGTCGITAILVAGPQGDVLLDTGTRDGSTQVMSNIRNLGFYQENLRAILTSHEHHDHVGGAYWVAQNTGARVYTSAKAAKVMETGLAGPDDPQYGMHEAMDRVPRRMISEVTPGQPLVVAGLSFTPIDTPGHTPGALSWQWRSCEGGDCRTIVFADSLSPVSSDSYRFSDHPAYLAAYREGLARVAALDCDILLTPHPSASGMRDKLVAGSLAAAPSCRDYADSVGKRLDERLAKERDGG